MQLGSKPRLSSLTLGNFDLLVWSAQFWIGSCHNLLPFAPLVQCFSSSVQRDRETPNSSRISFHPLDIYKIYIVGSRPSADIQIFHDRVISFTKMSSDNQQRHIDCLFTSVIGRFHEVVHQQLQTPISVLCYICSQNQKEEHAKKTNNISQNQELFLPQNFHDSVQNFQDSVQTLSIWQYQRESE